jgi:uncharacterized protein (TIGR00730 family)
MKSICVFCGSKENLSSVYTSAANELGRLLGEKDIRLIYGGGNSGLMGAVASSALSSGGKVTGIIPEDLMARERARSENLLELSELKIVKTMHQRKAMMAELSDGFIALPGGLGTLEEFFEIWTWAQLGIHSKPIGLLNVNDYFKSLITFLEHSVKEGFVSKVHHEMVIIEEQPLKLLRRMKEYKAPQVTQWINKSEI